MAKYGRKVLRLLAEEMTDTPLREIDALFEANEVPLGPPQPKDDDPGQRRERMRRYLASLDLDRSDDQTRFVGVLSDLMQDIVRRQGSFGGASEYVLRWIQTLNADGFEIDPDTHAVTEPRRDLALELAPAALAAIADPTVILDHLSRLSDAVDSDPRLAVSSGKALIESTAKIVLTSRGLSYTRRDDVTKLVPRAQEALGLAAKDASDEVPELRRILQSLVTLAQGVAEVRNQVGVDHGRESIPSWVRPRHARLVVGAAQVWCQLMLETLGDPDAPWRYQAEAS